MELGIFERQLRLMVLLTQNREYSLDELCRKLDMSRRTLYRYLELFRDIGFEVVKQGNVYRLDKSSPFFKEITQLVHFTEDEALTLRHVLDMASGTDVQVRHLRHKLERIYDFGILNAVEADPGQAEKLQQLYEAVKLHRQVVLHDYSSAHSNRTSDRVVYTDLFRFSGEERRRVVLRLGRLACSLLKEECPQAVRSLQPDGADHWLLSTDVCSFQGVGRFVLGLFEDVEVLESPEFKLFLQEKIKDLTKKVGVVS